ncbi:hypothetical protein EYF80_055081 [Liparis tanakae]|uniref:Uncharacterized protein n=1 Tax=Liparis tanakae TaxID=230148 RepID=A0A4Z2F0U3_9TELE|nr:hypothetical protein EYF80_055081 [Liparis tanakae]
MLLWRLRTYSARLSPGSSTLSSIICGRGTHQQHHLWAWHSSAASSVGVALISSIICGLAAPKAQRAVLAKGNVTFELRHKRVKLGVAAARGLPGRRHVASVKGTGLKGLGRNTCFKLEQAVGPASLCPPYRLHKRYELEFDRRRERENNKDAEKVTPTGRLTVGWWVPFPSHGPLGLRD